MIGTVQNKQDIIPFSQIKTDERPYDFRIHDTQEESPLKGELAMLGLVTPLVVEKKDAGAFILIDGHRRYDAICALRKEKGGWDEIAATELPAGQNSVSHIFKLLMTNNMKKENAYNIFEVAELISHFIGAGLSHTDIIKMGKFSQGDLNQFIVLSKTPSPLKRKLLTTPVGPAQAASLTFHYQKWKKSPYHAYADAVADKIIDHLQNEILSNHGWQFLIDFYWSKDHPFMAPPDYLP